MSKVWRDNKWDDEQVKKSGYEDEDPKDTCTHPGHNPPGHLYVPPGRRYRHVCIGCGREIVVRSNGCMW